MFERVWLILMLVSCALGAKILALMVVPSHSHHFWNVKYLEGLAKRGHDITYLSVDKYQNPSENIRNLFIENVYESLSEDFNLSALSDLGPYGNTILLQQWEDLSAIFQLRSKTLLQLKEILKIEKFDLVVHDIAGDSYILGAVDLIGRPPVIGITAFGEPTWSLETLGNPMFYSSKQHFYATYSNGMNIWQRANNFFLHLFYFAVRWFYMRKQNEYSLKMFGNDVRPLNDIMNDINIIMVNTNYGIDDVFPSVPGLIPVGGLHIEDPKPLPQELQTYLDNSKHGVIYFSLGSNLQSSQLGENKLQVLIKAFKELSPVQILWKWESDFFPNKPINVRIAKWLPQNDILAHTNVRLFFTHSGLLSTQEAIYHAKPIVGLPFFLDQLNNVKKCVEKGFGEQLDFATLTSDKVVKTLRKVFFDPKYTENVKNASILFKDQINNPLDRAIYWTEYAIRHKGAPHLRFSARNLHWYQNWMLDIVLLIFLIILLSFIIVYKCYKMLTSNNNSKNNSKIKSN